MSLWLKIRLVLALLPMTLLISCGTVLFAWYKPIDFVITLLIIWTIGGFVWSIEVLNS